MTKNAIAGGVVHRMPADLEKAILAISGAPEAWGNITSLVRNEFICWVDDAKKPETRAHRIKRTSVELAEGKRRPCCWIGCIHRTDKEISPYIKGMLSKRKKR
mgnify:CR=1 FL=1